MEPERLPSTQIADTNQIIDGAGVYRSRIANHANWTKPVAPVLSDCSFQCSDLHLASLIHRNLPQGISPQPQQSDGFVDTVVRLRRAIDSEGLQSGMQTMLIHVDTCLGIARHSQSD